MKQPIRIDVWMPLYIGDYLRDTIDLTNSEHGAYLRCLMKYWAKGESLTESELKAICGKDTDRVCQFFVFESYRWRHKRVDIELEKARNRAESARIRGERGVAARRAIGSLPPK